MSDARLLVVDDDEHVCRVVDRALESVVVCDTAGDVPSARVALRRRQYDLVLLDVGLPGLSGMTLLEELRAQRRKPPVVMMSGSDDLALAEEAVNRGASGFVLKPFRVKDLRVQVTAALVNARQGGKAADALTRTAIEAALTDRSTQEHRFACVVVNIEQLAVLGAVYGVETVDDLVASVAERLSELSPVHVLDCLGPATFVVTCALQSAGDVDRAARALHKVVSSPVMVSGRSVPVPVRLGIAVAAQNETSSALLRRAEAAAAEATRESLPYVLYDGDRWLEARRRMEFLADAATAIHGGDLHVAYQTQHDLTSGACVGVEALARWRHPGRGDVPANEFIPLAEQLGLIGELGARVRNLVYRDAARLRRAAPHGLRHISINVSASELRAPDFAEMMLHELTAADPPVGPLCVEVTESLALGDPSQIRTLTELATAGVRLAIDDFGSGYSSFANLTRVPWSELKIDREVTSVCDTAHGRDMLRAVLELGRALDVAVIAEGIENRNQLEQLRSLGCRYGQGFLLGKPQGIERLQLATFNLRCA